MTCEFSVAAWVGLDATVKPDHEEYFDCILAEAKAAAFALVKSGRFAIAKVYRRTDQPHGWIEIDEIGRDFVLDL